MSKKTQKKWNEECSDERLETLAPGYDLSEYETKKVKKLCREIYSYGFQNGLYHAQDEVDALFDALTSECD